MADAGYVDTLSSRDRSSTSSPALPEQVGNAAPVPSASGFVCVWFHHDCIITSSKMGADREEILGELLVLQQFGTRHFHQLYRPAHEPDIIDVLRPVRAGAGKPYPGAVGSGIGQDVMPKLRRKVVPDRDLPTPHAVRLRIAAPLVIPRRPMLSHVFPIGVDHGLQVLLLVRLYPFLGDPISLVLALSVNQILN